MKIQAILIAEKQANQERPPATRAPQIIKKAQARNTDKFSIEDIKARYTGGENG